MKEPQALMVAGTIVGIFSTEEAAEGWARSHDEKTFSIYPISTWFETDMADE